MSDVDTNAINQEIGGAHGGGDEEQEGGGYYDEYGNWRADTGNYWPTDFNGTRDTNEANKGAGKRESHRPNPRPPPPALENLELHCPSHLQAVSPFGGDAPCVLICPRLQLFTKSSVMLRLGFISARASAASDTMPPPRAFLH